MRTITEINPKGLLDNLFLDQDSEYRERKDELDRYKAALHNLRKQKQDILGGLNRDTKESDDAVVERALARAEGHEIPLTATTDNLRKKFEQISMEVAGLEKDCKEKEVQLKKLSFAVAERLIAPLRPHHAALVRQIAVAVAVVSKAHDAESEFRETLRLRDIPIDSLCDPMPFGLVGSLKDDQSRGSMYLTECLERGFLAQDEVDRLRKVGVL